MAHTTAKNILEDHIDILHKLSDLLLEQETVLGKELDDLIFSLHPNIELPSKEIGEESETEAETAETAPNPAGAESEAVETSEATADTDAHSADADNSAAEGADTPSSASQKDNE
jgi:cell division protease FtsH